MSRQRCGTAIYSTSVLSVLGDKDSDSHLLHVVLGAANMARLGCLIN